MAKNPGYFSNSKPFGIGNVLLNEFCNCRVIHIFSNLLYIESCRRRKGIFFPARNQHFLIMKSGKAAI